MYEKFYNLAEKPFNTTPDSKFFFPSSKHSEALNSLIYAINERKGFVVITGEIGAGKTTVCRTLLNKLNVNTKIATIVNTHLTPKDLIAAILDEFDIESPGGNKQRLLKALNEYLIRQLSSDMNVVLIIDEAQNLTPACLEEVRMLSNLETEKEKLIQIILLGQPQLRAKLDNAKLEQFKQRIAVYYHLNALNKEETREYINHRLALVGANGKTELFTPDAIDLLFEYSRGIPRLINLTCDSALLSGYVYGVKQINARIMREVIKERGGIDVPESLEQARPETYCCQSCHKFMVCDIKWQKGIAGEKQLCCDQCRDYWNCGKISTKEMRTFHG